MKNKYLVMLAKCLQLASLSVLAFAVFVSATGAAQATHQVAGKWKMTVSGSYEFELQLRQSGQDFEGTMKRTNGDEPIDPVFGTVQEDGAIQFERRRGAEAWIQRYTGRVDFAGALLRMTGNWSHLGSNSGGSWVAAKH